MRHFSKEGELVTIKQFLFENFFLFKSVSEKNIDHFLTFDGITEEEYSQGDIMLNNSTNEKIGIIVKGKAIIKSGSDGVIIRKLSKNDVFGAASLFDSPTHLTSVICVTDCSIITFNRSFVERCINEESQVAINYIDFLSKRISFLNSKINSYTAKSAENKLYSYLLQLPREGIEASLTIDLSTLAKMIGIGRATLYRAFDKLESEGLITKQDKKIIFHEV